MRQRLGSRQEDGRAGGGLSRQRGSHEQAQPADDIAAHRRVTESQQLDFEEEEISPKHEKAVIPFFKSSKQQKPKTATRPLLELTLKCNQSTPAEEKRGSENCRLPNRGCPRQRRAGRSEGTAEGHKDRLGDGQQWSFRAGDCGFTDVYDL